MLTTLLAEGLPPILFRKFAQNVGSLGFEPRLPTPQAGILDQSTRKSLRIPSTEERSDFLDQARLRPQQSTKYEGLIIKTLLELQKEGKAENTMNVDDTYTLYSQTPTPKKNHHDQPILYSTLNQVDLCFRISYVSTSRATQTRPKRDNQNPI